MHRRVIFILFDPDMVSGTCKYTPHFCHQFLAFVEDGIDTVIYKVSCEFQVFFRHRTESEANAIFK